MKIVKITLLCDRCGKNMGKYNKCENVSVSYCDDSSEEYMSGFEYHLCTTCLSKFVKIWKETEGRIGDEKCKEML